MRIMMVSHGYPPVLSGVSRVVQKVSRAMSKEGHQVLVVTASDRGPVYRQHDNGVDIERVQSIPNVFWSEGRIPVVLAKTLLQKVDTFEPDIIHCHENAIMSTQLLRAIKTRNLPALSSCYSLPRFVTEYLPAGKTLEKPIEGFMWRFLVWNLNQYDHVIFATELHRRYFARHGLKVPATTISNGVDTERYRPLDGRSENVDERYGLPPRPRILFVSRIARDKNIDVLLRAMPAVHAQSGGHLLLAGRGDYRDTLQEEARELGVAHCVHFLGFVPEQDLPALYRASDVFVMPSTCETQSIPALQALSSGLPVVLADAGALPELVEPGANGYLVPPDDPDAYCDALMSILSNSHRMLDFGRAAVSIGRHHSDRYTFRAMLALYRQLI